MQRPRDMVPFGKFLSRQRRAKHLSAEGVVRRMKHLGVQLDASTLYNYEAGTVRAPDPGVLWALSKIYAVSLDELIALLVSVRAGKGGVPPTASTNSEPDGHDRTKLLSAAERELLDEWSKLTPRGRDSLRNLLAELQPRKVRQKRTA